MIKQKYLLLSFVCFFLMSTIYLTHADVVVTAPLSGVEYDNEMISVKAYTSSGYNYSAPQIITVDTWLDPVDMINIGDYYQNYLDASNIENSLSYEITVRAYNLDTEQFESDSITIKISHPADTNPTPTPTPTPTPLKTMKVTGISNSQKITDNETRMIYVKTNNTDQPVEGATIYILKDASTISNTFLTSTSGRAKIEWIDTDGNPLPNDIYFFKIEKAGYRTIEYDIEIYYSEEEEEKPELNIWGLDRKYNTDSIAPDIVRVKGSDTNKYLSDVVIKIITGSGVPVTDNMITNEYGTIDFKTTGITPGSYSVVFEHPDYETKLQDITISFVPTPTPTPPTEFIWNGITFPIPHTVTLRDGTVKSYTTSSGFDADFMKDSNGATVERAKATPTPTPAPTIQANSTGVPTDTPTIKAGWVLLAIAIIGIVGRVAYKNYSQINPASGGFTGIISGLKNRTTQDDSFIPEQVNTPDIDIGMSTLPSVEDMEEVKEAISTEVLQPGSVQEEIIGTEEPEK